MGILQPLRSLWTPPAKSLMRKNPTGPLLRAPSGGLAGSADCCCDDEKPCDYFRGNLDAGDVHPHASSIWVEFDDPWGAPSLGSSTTSVDCCEDKPLLHELLIRDYTDHPDPEYIAFGVCPGTLFPNCWAVTEPCITYDYQNGIGSIIQAVCRDSHLLDAEDGSLPCYAGVVPIGMPAGHETIWSVMVYIQGRGGVVGPPPHDCNAVFRLEYACSAPIGTVTNFAGTWNLTLGYFPPVLTFPNFFYCSWPSTLTLYAGVPLP